MFTLAELPFAQPDTPAPLHQAFAELRQALAPFAPPRNVDTLAEVVWSALHGLATLSRSHRLRPDHAEQRLALLVRTATTSGDALRDPARAAWPTRPGLRSSARRSAPPAGQTCIHNVTGILKPAKRSRNARLAGTGPATPA